jgi:hypothetical protein
MNNWKICERRKQWRKNNEVSKLKTNEKYDKYKIKKWKSLRHTLKQFSSDIFYGWEWKFPINIPKRNKKNKNKNLFVLLAA